MTITPWRRAAVTLAASAALGSALAVAAPGAARAAAWSAASPAAPCDGWTTSTLAAGLGSLENLEPDGAGGVYLSATDKHAVEHLAPGATTPTVVAAGLDSPGGLRLQGNSLYALTGNSGAATLLGLRTGTLERIDVRTGAVTRVAAGLVAPNGLLGLPDGSFLASRVGLGLTPTGITRIVPSTGAVTPKWSPVWQGNGMVLSPDRGSVYVDATITGDVLRVPLDAPGHQVTVAHLPGLLPEPDDLDIASDGILYVAANQAGAVYRVDPATGATCAVATGLSNPSAVKITPGPGGTALLVSSFDGTLRRILPPGGVRL